jgi:AAA domain, putative AbiEii toxin, Type IV TA system/AAA ATPase domain
MLTKLIVRNFKRFRNVEIELGNPVVFIGPNNSGKTTALQALALWDVGLRRWNEKRGASAGPKKRPGVTINRRDLVAVPVPQADLLWRDLHVRDVQKSNGKQQTSNIRVDIIVEGVSGGKAWSCGLEFDYANQESFYCRPLRLSDEEGANRMTVPFEAAATRVNFLPPMSGLADREFQKQPGEIGFLIGQGRTAEVLRNLCYQLSTTAEPALWVAICKRMKDLFGVDLETPEYVPERSEITMAYRDRSRVRLDLSSSGRGLQQTLLLCAYLAVNPGSVLLLDEPDAHLEILRQRQIYQLLTEAAQEQGSQIVAASHSEVILNEAADRDVVVAFVGTPHRIDDRGNQVLKSLKDIGFEQYYQADDTGWVLYLEGSTELAILKAFAERLGHSAKDVLERPFVHYVQNLPRSARNHFRGLREARTDLVGFLLCDRIEYDLQPTPELGEYAWRRREIENYLCQPETLLTYAEDSGMEESAGPLFHQEEIARRREAMQKCIEDFVPPVAMRNRSDRWWTETKMSDDFLDRLFDAYFQLLSLPNLMRKTDYHRLARFVRPEQLEGEVRQVLDGIAATAGRANPAVGANGP